MRFKSATVITCASILNFPIFGRCNYKTINGRNRAQSCHRKLPSDDDNDSPGWRELIFNKDISAAEISNLSAIGSNN